MQLQVVVTTLVAAAVVGRLLNDNKHNKKLERTRRDKAAAKAAKLLREAERRRSLEVQEEAVQRSQRENSGCEGILIVSLLAAGPTALLPLVLTHAKGVSLLAGLISAAFLIALVGSFVQAKRRQTRKQERTLKADLHLVPKPAVAENLTGTWVKDKHASESMAKAIELARLSQITRTAVKLIKGIQIVQSPESLEMTVYSVIGWFKVREVYPMSGEMVKQKRRDLRRGKLLGHHTGRALITATGRTRLELEWPDPVGGQGSDEFYLANLNELHVRSHVAVDGQAAEYVTVYHKRA